MKKIKATALETCGYPEYQVPNWIEGQEYEAIDKGETMVLSSETGNFYFTGKAKERLPEIFKFQS